MITATLLSMRFGSKILFRNVSLQLNPGNHYGLVGANGTGKSTLLKILMGEELPEAGDVVIPAQVTLGTLKQDHFLYEELPLLHVVLKGNRTLWQALERKQTLLDQEHFNEAACHELEALDKTIQAEDGYSAESHAAKLLVGLGLSTETHMQPLKTLSGGYKLRVLLAQVLFSRPSLLLLDEPTNHLDLFSIRWLEGYLRSFPGTLVISSHDRNFLNAVCDHILDLDHETVKVYKGNYEAFLETKAEQLELAAAQLEKQEKRRDDLQGFVDRFKAKATKARQAQSKMRLVQKLEASMQAYEQAPSSRRYPVLEFALSRPSGAIALKVADICKSYGEKQVLKGISFEVERGDKVALLGPNGVGKSTLLDILANSQAAGGGSYTWGHAVALAYFPQDHKKHVSGSISVLDWLAQWDRLAVEQTLRDLLGKVLFSGDDVYKPVDVLSGGEAARLLLARTMLQKHNVLIFDEPTNHLDMESAEMLSEALKEYPGTLLFVSHNRDFVSAVASRIIELTPEGLLDFRCSFEEYLEKRDLDLLALDKREREKTKSKTGAEAFQQTKQQLRQQNQNARKVKSAEERCQALEMEIHQLDAKMAEEGFYTKSSREQIQELTAQKAALQNALEKAFEAWEKLLQDS